MNASRGADDAATLSRALQDQLRVRAEQARLQEAMIEMLSSELRECRKRLVEQNDEITEYRRLLMTRHDLLMSRYSATLAAPAAGPEPSRFRRTIRRVQSALRLLTR
jgi:hypothetical protein